LKNLQRLPELGSENQILRLLLDLLQTLRLSGHGSQIVGFGRGLF